jgi:tRNA(Ile2) C34 agmatinyltransferase TiaS
MADNDNCYQCGGEVEVEVVGQYRDWVCQQCGIVVNSEKIIEDQEEYTEEEGEVME